MAGEAGPGSTKREVPPAPEKARGGAGSVETGGRSVGAPRGPPAKAGKAARRERRKPASFAQKAPARGRRKPDRAAKAPDAQARKADAKNGKVPGLGGARTAKGAGHGSDAGRAKSAGKRFRELPPLRDPERFMASIEGKARLIREGYDAGVEAAPAGLRAKGLLLAGMGFSGMVGNLVKDAATRALRIPLNVVKHYQLPNHVRPGWHALAVSYSGDTEETLSVVRAARERGVDVTGFSTGGQLAALVRRTVPQPPGYQPRAAFAHTWFSALGFLEAAGILNERVPVRQAMDAVAEVDALCRPDVPEARNPAKRLARQLWKPIPQIYTTPAFLGVGLHFRGMLNENAKKIAKVDLVPESNHNDLTGWGGDTENRRHFAVLCLSHASQNPELRQRLEFMELRYRRWGVPWTNLQSGPIESFADHVVEQARAIQFLDYTSVYVAALRGQDPAEISEIRALKTLLREGRAD